MYFEGNLSDFDMNWLVNTVNERIGLMDEGGSGYAPEFTAAYLGENYPDDLLLGVTPDDVLNLLEDMGDDIPSYSNSELSQIATLLNQYGAHVDSGITSGIGTDYNLVHTYGADVNPIRVARQMFVDNPDAIRQAYATGGNYLLHAEAVAENMDLPIHQTCLLYTSPSPRDS